MLPFLLISINDFIQENELIQLVNSKNKVEYENVHLNVVGTRNYLLDKYIQEPKSDEQLALWMTSRGVLRQSAADSIVGKVTRCGENARLMVKVLRAQGIKSKRLYLYGGEGTSHVLFEYYNELDDKWYLINTFGTGGHLTSLFDDNKVSKSELFQRYTVAEIIYSEVSDLNFPLKKLFGADVELPYFVTYFMDEKYLIQIVAISGFMFLLFFIRIFLVMKIKND
jgi:hypothetical protein